MSDFVLIQADAARIPLADGSVSCVCTSPPYWGLRAYSGRENPASIGLEPTFTCDFQRCGRCFLCRIVAVFREVRRVLRDDGVCLINMGFSYAGGGRGGNPEDSPFRKQATNRGSLIAPVPHDGFKAKDLVDQPAFVAEALRRDGWYYRMWIPWLKKSPMPESVTDRVTKACEVVLMFSKAANYWYDAEAVKRRSDKEWTDEQYAAHLVETSEQWYPRVNIDSGEVGIKHGSKKGGFAPPGGRNFRQSDLFMDSVKGLLCDDDGDPLAVVTSSEPLKAKHYAAFPPKLVEAFIPACVPKKCCAKCGAGYVRVTERNGEWRATHNRPQKHNGEIYRRNPGGGICGPNTTSIIRTVGWNPGCSCNAGTVPGILLDPFSGAGSSAIACIRQGRRFVGVELSSEYVDLARRRVAKFLRPTVAPPLVAEPEQAEGMLFA